MIVFLSSNFPAYGQGFFDKVDMQTANNQVLLHTLPSDHIDRNRPLLGCFYKWKYGVMWNEIKAPYGIAAYTYNQLGHAWVDNDFFTWDAPT